MYTLSAGGYMNAVKDGKLLWEHFLDHNYEGSSPVLSPDRAIITLSAGGYLTSTRGSISISEAEVAGRDQEPQQPSLEQDNGYIIADGIRLPIKKES